MAQVFYCKGWFRAKKRALEIYTPARAEALHEKGELYCVLIGSTAEPICFLEISNRSVGVGFLDTQLREVLSYAFQEKESDRLFLSMATHRQFDGNSDKVLGGTSYIFNPDGKLVIRREEFHPTHALEASETSADVSTNWESFPEFGRYDHLIKAERNAC